MSSSKALRQRGFVLFTVLFCLVIASILTMAMLRSVLLSYKISQQIQVGLDHNLQVRTGLLHFSSADLVNLSSQWQPVPISAEWPVHFNLMAKKQYRKFLPDSLAFNENSGVDIYQGSAKNADHANEVKWSFSWWQRQFTTENPSRIITRPSPISRYDSSLSAWPTLQKSYRTYLQDKRKQTAMIYQLDRSGELQVVDYQTQRILYRKRLAVSHAKQPSKLLVADVDMQGTWHTVLLVSIVNQLWLFDISDGLRYGDLPCCWHRSISSASGIYPSLFRASNGQWLILLSLEHKPVEIRVLDLYGTLLHTMPLADDSTEITSATVVDIQQNLIGNWAYLGDGEGRVWALDLTSSRIKQWQAKVIFRATDNTQQTQKIQLAPIVALGAPGIALYVMAHNSQSSSLYTLLPKYPNQILNRQQLMEADWPASPKATEQGWVVNAVNGMQFVNLRIIDDRLWYVLQDSHQFWLGVLQRLTGTTPMPVFQNSTGNYLKLPIKQLAWTLQFLDNPPRIEIAGNTVVIYPHPFRSSRQGMHRVIHNP